MSLEMAKARRIDALRNRDGDRVMVKPAAHHSQMCLPNAGSAAEYIIQALERGTSIHFLSAETGWSRAAVLANLYTVAKKTGVGIRKSEGRLHLMLPPNASTIRPAPKVVGSSCTERCDASEASIMDVQSN